MSKVPILVYHSPQVLGNTYETNDHVALYHDLRVIHAQGFRIVPLRWIAEWVLGQREEPALYASVGISFDDSSDFDYYDINHPRYGPQRSFYNILRDFQKEFGSSAQPYLHASSFVIVSPTVRHEIGQQSFAGFNWMTEGWWQEAQNSELLEVHNHSWDHNHPDASITCEKNQRRGTFHTIDTYAECQGEVKQAAEYIHQRIYPTWPDLFAYPWGQASDYLRETYFPSFHEQHRTMAAFGATGGYVTRTTARWNLPRFVCGAPWPEGWRSTDELIRILHGMP